MRAVSGAQQKVEAKQRKYTVSRRAVNAYKGWGTLRPIKVQRWGHTSPSSSSFSASSDGKFIADKIFAAWQYVNCDSDWVPPAASRLNFVARVDFTLPHVRHIGRTVCILLQAHFPLLCLVCTPATLRRGCGLHKRVLGSTLVLRDCRVLASVDGRLQGLRGKVTQQTQFRRPRFL
jgi:hypothetical protein